MKKVRIILTGASFLFAIVAAFAFNTPTETAWFALDPDTGAVDEYIGAVQPDCIAQSGKLCAAEYAAVDQDGDPVGPQIQILEGVRVP